MLAATLLVAVAASAGVLPAFAAPASPTEPGAAGAAPSVEVELTQLAPVSVRPGDRLTVTGRVVNRTSSPLTGLSLLVGVGPHVASRAALVTSFARAPSSVRVLRASGGISVVGSAASAGTTASTPATPSTPNTLAAGASATFTLTADIDANDLDIGQATVYPLVVRARGRLGPGGTRTVGEADSYLPYFPGSVTAPLRVAWLWPLDAAPALDAGGAVLDPKVPDVFADGRLRRLIDLGSLRSSAASTGQAGAGTSAGTAGAYAPVTWAIEPSLLQTAEAVGAGTWTRRAVQNGTDGAAGAESAPSNQPASAEARRWLADLRSATTAGDVIALPYADPDAVALVRAGASTDLSSAVALGRADIAAALPRAHVERTAWPVDGLADQDTVDAFTNAGVSQIVLDGDLVPTSDDATTATQSAPVLLETRGPHVRGVAVDPVAAQLLAGNGRDQATPRMSAQRLLALLAVAVDERPNQTPSRDMVLALPRTADPDPGWLTGLLHDTATLPWLTPVTLAQTTSDPTGDRQSLQAYPAAARAKELPAATVRAVIGLRAEVTDLRSMLPDDTLTQPLDQALTRAESAFGRSGGDAAQVAAIRLSAQRAIAGLANGVRVAVVNVVTLTSKDGKVPLTLDNALTEPATVTVAIEATDRTKLVPTAPKRITVPAGSKVRVQLPATAERAGSFRVQLAVATPSGRQLTTAPITIHSKAYGTITLVITFVALGVLVLALVIRIWRRVRRWRTGGPDNPGGDQPGPEGPEPREPADIAPYATTPGPGR